MVAGDDVDDLGCMSHAVECDRDTVKCTCTHHSIAIMSVGETDIADYPCEDHSEMKYHPTAPGYVARGSVSEESRPEGNIDTLVTIEGIEEPWKVGELVLPVRIVRGDILDRATVPTYILESRLKSRALSAITIVMESDESRVLGSEAIEDRAGAVT